MRHRLNQLVPHLVLACLLFPLAGCGTLCTFGLGCDPAVDVTVTGAADMNGGNAASVVVYQLSNDTNFRRTPIEAFWRNDGDALGDELVGRKREILLYPDEERTIEIALEEKANFIGIAANLREPEPDQWRRIYPVEEVEGEHTVIQVGANQLIVNVE